MIIDVPDDVPRPVVEIVRAILAHQDEIGIFEGRRGMLYIDYAPGNIKLRLDKVRLEPVGRVALA